MSRKKTPYVGKCVSVDCEHNDSVDVRCGGPNVLGFDFVVDAKEDANSIRRFIQQELKKHKLPLMNIKVSRSRVKVPKSKLWTRCKIANEIKKGY